MTVSLLFFLIVLVLVLVVVLDDLIIDLGFAIFGPILGISHVQGLSFAFLFNATFIPAFVIDGILLMKSTPPCNFVSWVMFSIV